MMLDCELGTLIFLVCLASFSQGHTAPDGGFLKREYSLMKPYSGNGMTMPFWEFRDNAMMTNNFIRLTSNHQGQLGSVWNRQPCFLRDWETHVHFKVHGGGRTLAADGMTFWYTQERMTPGPVFGSRDEFHGLAVFLDTYKNGQQAVTFPQISAMVGNGSMKYDHMGDGRLNSVGSCLASFRNKDYDTYMSIRYVKQRLTIQINVDNQGKWRECLDVSGVMLPSGYFFGVSAATGDLADNHDLISIKTYQLEIQRTPEEEAEEWANVLPGIKFLKPPIDNVDEDGKGDYRNTSVSGSKMLLIIICGLLGAGICIVVGFVVFQKRQEQNRKRFY